MYTASSSIGDTVPPYCGRCSSNRSALGPVPRRGLVEGLRRLPALIPVRTLISRHSDYTTSKLAFVGVCSYWSRVWIPRSLVNHDMVIPLLCKWKLKHMDLSHRAYQSLQAATVLPGSCMHDGCSRRSPGILRGRVTVPWFLSTIPSLRANAQLT